MNIIKREAGFTFIGILIAVAIVGILMVMSLQSYGPVMKGMEPGGGSGPSFGLSIARTHMKQLHEAELMYYNMHRKYATWSELMKDGEIQQGYSDKATGKGTPFIPNYDIDIQVTSTGFNITATPSLAAGAQPGSPTLTIDQEGNLVEVPAK